jgi:hypothetical protein
VQLIGTKGLSLARAAEMDRAGDDSLPVPLSPVIRTLVLVSATWAISSKTSCIGRL